MSRFGLAFVGAAILAPHAVGQSTLYVADNDDGTVKQVVPGGGSFANDATGFSSPVGLAMSQAGVLYVSDLTAGTVNRIPAGGGTPAVYASGFSGPAGI